ncbi:MAG: hypothetical protein IPH64_03625 [Comamonadaceae bacterium]|nr:hypothetical protein [Comamonadaceae bacterium]
MLARRCDDRRCLIAARTGRPLTDDWLSAFYERRNQALREGLAAIDGAHEAVAAAHARVGGRIACASGADRFKVEMQLAQGQAAAVFRRPGVRRPRICHAPSPRPDVAWPPPTTGRRRHARASWWRTRPPA